MSGLNLLDWELSRAENGDRTLKYPPGTSNINGVEVSNHSLACLICSIYEKEEQTKNAEKENKKPVTPFEFSKAITEIIGLEEIISFRLEMNWDDPLPIKITVEHLANKEIVQSVLALLPNGIWQKAEEQK